MKKRLKKFLIRLLKGKQEQFMLDFSEIYTKYDISVKGAIIVGAHEFREGPQYFKRGISDFVLIEPASQAFNYLEREYGNYLDDIKLFKCACGAVEQVRILRVETKNAGQSNSILEPDEHLKQYPDIQFPGYEHVKVHKLDNIPFDRSKYNFLSIDTQCSEYEVLEGAIYTLPSIDYILCEVNKRGASMYKGCTNIEEVDWFLKAFGFKRVTEPKWINNSYSDAFYIRKTLLNDSK